MESFQMPSLNVSDFMYSAALSLFWPYLNKHAPVVQNTVEPSPPAGLGNGPSWSLLGSGQVAAKRSGAFWYLTQYVALWAAEARASAWLLTPASVVPVVRMVGAESAFKFFMISSDCRAVSLLKSKKRTGVTTVMLMLWGIGASERQPWASKTTP